MMIRRAAMIELWLSLLIFSASVGYGIVDRWGRLEALFIGIPLLLWAFYTWRAAPRNFGSGNGIQFNVERVYRLPD